MTLPRTILPLAAPLTAAPCLAAKPQCRNAAEQPRRRMHLKAMKRERAPGPRHQMTGPGESGRSREGERGAQSGDHGIPILPMDGTKRLPALQRRSDTDRVKLAAGMGLEVFEGRFEGPGLLVGALAGEGVKTHPPPRRCGPPGGSPPPPVLPGSPDRRNARGGRR